MLALLQITAYIGGTVWAINKAIAVANGNVGWSVVLSLLLIMLVWFVIGLIFRALYKVRNFIFERDDLRGKIKYM